MKLVEKILHVTQKVTKVMQVVITPLERKVVLNL